MKILDRIKSFLGKDKPITLVNNKGIITCTIVKSLYNSDQKVGLNFSPFILQLDKDLFKVNDRIESELGILCKVTNILKLENNIFVEVVLFTNVVEHYCPASELKIGKQWKVQTRFFSES